MFNGKKAFEIKPSTEYDDYHWWENQKIMEKHPNEGWWVIHEGEARGTILGGNLCTFNLLQGTEYFPKLRKTILFIEDDLESKAVNFDRDLQSLIHLPRFSEVKGIVIGRFQNASEVSREKLFRIITTKKELENIPVMANVDFGHTYPMITYPIGGKARIKVQKADSHIQIRKH